MTQDQIAKRRQGRAVHSMYICTLNVLHIHSGKAIKKQQQYIIKSNALKKKLLENNVKQAFLRFSIFDKKLCLLNISDQK